MAQNVSADVDADVYFYGYSDDNYGIDYDSYTLNKYAVRFCGDPLWVKETFSEWRLPLFSWCFQHAVLAQLPVLFFFLSLPFLWMRYRTRGGVGALPYDWLASMKYGLAVIMASDKLALLVRSLYQWAFDKQNVPLIEFIYPVVNAITLTCIIMTMNCCRSAGIVAPGALFWTWALFAVCSVPEFFVWIIIGTNPLTVNSVDFSRYLAFLIWFPLCCLQLLLHFFPDHVFDSKHSSRGSTVDNEARASPFSRHFFTWFTCVISHVRSGEQIDVNALPALPQRLRARTLFAQWNGEWMRRIKTMERKRHQFSSFNSSYHHFSRHDDAVQVGGDSLTTVLNNASDRTPLIGTSYNERYGSVESDKKHSEPQPPSIFWCLLRIQRWPLAYSCAFRVIADVSRFIGPLLLIELICFLKVDTLPHWRGCGIALAMFVGAQIASMAHGTACTAVGQMRIGAQGMLRAAVYDKVLRLFATARFATDRCALSNVIGDDVANAERAVVVVVRVVSFIIQTILGVTLLWRTVGAASFVAITFLVIYGYCNARLEAVEKSTHSTSNKATKLRVEMLRILLREAKFLEEQAIKTDVVGEAERLRDAEMRYIRRAKTGQCALSIFNESAEFVAFFLTLICYVALNARNAEILPPATIFVSIFLISILRRSFCAAAKLQHEVKAMNSSNERLAALLLDEEIDQTQVERDLHPEYERAVDIQLASFDDGSTSDGCRPPGYRHSPHIVHATYALNDVEMHIKRGVVAAVVSAPDDLDGGTHLIHAMMGEMRKVYGYVGLRGRVAYCSRRPWLFDGTVRANILLQYSGGETTDDDQVDEKRYRLALDACELNALPRGDHTPAIDEDRDNVDDFSVQIALARLIYRRADIYLFEDVLSTMRDMALAARLYERIIGGGNGDDRPLLDGCTRIVIERRQDYVKQANLVVLVDERKVKFSGTQDELARDKFARQLVDRYTTDESFNLQTADLLETESDLEVDVSLLRTEVAEMTRPVDAEPARSARMSYVSTARGHLFTIAVNFMTGSVAFAVINQYWLCDWANPQSGEKSEVSERFLVFFIIGVFVVLSQAAGLFAAMYGTVQIGQRAFDVVAGTLRKIPLDAIPRRKIALLHYSAVKDIERVDWAAGAYFEAMLLNAFRVLFILIIFVVRWPYLVIAFIIATAAAFPITVSFVEVTTPLRRIGVATLDVLLLRVCEAVDGLRTLRAADATVPFFRDFLTLVDRRGTAEYARMAARRWMAARMELIGSFFILAVGLSGAFSSFFQLTPSFVALFVITSYQLGDSLKEFARKLADFEFEAAGVRRIFEIQTLTPEKVHIRSDKAKTLSTRPKISGDESAGRWHGDVQIVDLACNQKKPLPKFSAHFKPGAKIGIHKCGAASDALWAALTGRVAPAGGRVTIDGVDALCGAHFAVVSAHAPLLVGRLRFNLDPAGIRSDAQLWRAVESANMREFVESSPSGLDLHINAQDAKDSEVRVSIAIARAILRRRRHLLLIDDAQFATSSAFDVWARQRLYDEFVDATIIHFSAHPENLAGCDRIIDLQSNNQPSDDVLDSQILKTQDSE